MKKRTVKLAAIALTLGMMMTGCGSTGGGSTATDPQHAGTTSDPGSVVEPEKPNYGVGITNLSASAAKIEIPETPMQGAHGAALSKSGEVLLSRSMELANDPNGNYLISPISIQMALGMCATGSDPDSATRKELMNVLFPGCGDDPSVLNEEMATFAKRMVESKEAGWNVANSIWVNDNGRVKLRDSYIRDAVNYYKAELFQAPFDTSTVEAINQWVKENTRERIPEILEDLSPEARIALVNALAFDGEWAVQYEETQVDENGKFTNANGEEKTVAMLYSQEDRAIKLAGGVGFIKPYKGGQYSFVGILPPEGMSTADYMKKIAEDPTSFAEAYLAPEYNDVYVTMPEFKAEYGSVLNDLLKSLGVQEAYSDNAHFQAMVSDDSMPVKIGTVIHKTMIEVDRHGTKAAAATVVIMDEAAAIPMEEPIFVKLDRPFVYAIVDDASGVPVFLGVQNSME